MRGGASLHKASHPCEAHLELFRPLHWVAGQIVKM